MPKFTHQPSPFPEETQGHAFAYKVVRPKAVPAPTLLAHVTPDHIIPLTTTL